MSKQLKLVPFEICFSKKQQYKPSRVSDFLEMPRTEASETPVYYHFKKVLYKDTTFIALYYSLFYQANPGYICKLGFHIADVERLIILCDFKTLEPMHVFFGAHGNGQGTWRAYKDCEKNQNGILRVYVSPQSHAFYPHAKCHWRLFGFANDVTCGDGEKWVPKARDYSSSQTQSWTISHYQVVRGVNNPKNVPDPESKSISPLQRFMIAFPCVCICLKYVPKICVLDTLHSSEVGTELINQE